MGSALICTLTAVSSIPMQSPSFYAFMKPVSSKACTVTLHCGGGFREYIEAALRFYTVEQNATHRR